MSFLSSISRALNPRLASMRLATPSWCRTASLTLHEVTITTKKLAASNSSCGIRACDQINNLNSAPLPPRRRMKCNQRSQSIKLSGCLDASHDFRNFPVYALFLAAIIQSQDQPRPHLSDRVSVKFSRGQNRAVVACDIQAFWCSIPISDGNNCVAPVLCFSVHHSAFWQFSNIRNIGTRVSRFQHRKCRNTVTGTAAA